MSLEPVRLDTPWGVFHALRDPRGRLHCPVCRRFMVYSAKDLVYHVSFHVYSRMGVGGGRGGG